MKKVEVTYEVTQKEDINLLNLLLLNKESYDKEMEEIAKEKGNIESDLFPKLDEVQKESKKIFRKAVLSAVILVVSIALVGVIQIEYNINYVKVFGFMVLSLFPTMLPMAIITSRSTLKYHEKGYVKTKELLDKTTEEIRKLGIDEVRERVEQTIQSIKSGNNFDKKLLKIMLIVESIIILLVIFS